MIKKIYVRLLTFLIGFPSVLAYVFLLPQNNHLATNIAAIVVSALGAIELSFMLSGRRQLSTAIEAGLLGALIPLAATLQVSFGIDDRWTFIAMTLAMLYILSARVFSRTEEMNIISGKILAGFSALLYPGILLFWIIRMNAVDHTGILTVVFLFMVFGNDSVAWAAGMLFGKGNRGMIPASPNKSIAGFLGGIIISVAIGITATFLFPSIFHPGFGSNSFSGAILGFFTGIAAIVGDLAESTIKRSLGVKDSGSIIPGRGGILDSIDSIAMAAPVFHALFHAFFSIAA